MSNHSKMLGDYSRNLSLVILSNLLAINPSEAQACYLQAIGELMHEAGRSAQTGTRCVEVGVGGKGEEGWDQACRYERRVSNY